MRHVELPEQVDILITELLGSFGDNELSPECLDGAMRFLKPDGISIPSSYSAHLAPLSSSKLYNNARISREIKGMETPYVVMFQNVNILSGDGGGVSGRCGRRIQRCWEFEHPRKDATVDERGLPLTNSHNVRSAKLSFHIPHAGVMHGLAGYFEATLYGHIGLSIHPHSKDRVSKDMLSWFPLFFPFKEPLYLPSNSELHVSIWRLTNERQVWYEWYAESFLPVFSIPSSPEHSEDTSGDGSFFACTSAHVAVPSPVIDAIDAFPSLDRSESRKSEEESLKSTAGVIKIGQTSLHNPGGRSSWIGL
jgi:protein arginine N-methyltransferase 5